MEQDEFDFSVRRPPASWFDGATYDHLRDAARLNTQMGRVWDLMRDGEWRTLSQIAQAVSGSEAAVSARLRDLRKPRFGGCHVHSEYVRRGLWRYRLLPSDYDETTHLF